MSSNLVILVAAAVIILWMYSVYVSLIKKRNKALEAFSSIDVQLKKRYDLIPNILTIAQKFMEHERGLMEEVTKLRTKVAELPANFENIDRKIALDGEIAKKMGQIIVAVENYPQLKSDETMKTSIDGVYAAGDVRKTPLRQVITAASDGAVSAVYAVKYLESIREIPQTV